MCEHFIARAAEPFRLDELWPFTEKLERFGIAGFGGAAWLDGTPHHYAGNGENPVFGFRLGRIGLVSTGIYSLDRSLFRFVAPGAVERRLVPLRTTVRLDGDGTRVAGA